jgi:hypothetical protein
LTIRNDFVSLWDNGTDKLCLFAISPEYQYEYIIGKDIRLFKSTEENVDGSSNDSNCKYGFDETTDPVLREERITI